MQVCARLNEGMDSFVRIVNYLRRKEIGIKSINMRSLEGSIISLNMDFTDEHSSKYILNNILKLEDVEDIEVIKEEFYHGKDVL